MVGKQLGFSMVQYGALPNAPEPERCVGVERENCKPLATETRGFVRHLNKSTLPTASHKGGDICAVRVDRSDATLKYLDLYVSPETVLLRAHNPEYPSTEVEASRVVVDGVFSGLLRGDVIGDLLHGAGDMN